MLDEKLLYAQLTTIETMFNIIDCIPVVGAWGAGFRATAANVEAIAGVVFMVIGASDNSKAASTFYGRVGFELLAHGLLNFVRSALEAAGAIYTLGIGNMSFLAVSRVKTGNFGPWFEYGHFSKA